MVSNSPSKDAAASPAADIEMGVTKPNNASSPAASSSVYIPPEPKPSKGLLKPIPETTILERVMMGVAGVAVITAIVAMAIEDSVFVMVGGVLSILMGPYAYYQQVQLTDIKVLKETETALHAAVDDLQKINNDLHSNVEKLCDSVTKLRNMESALDMITKDTGSSISKLRSQVKENEQLLEKLKNNAKTAVLLNLLELLLRSDTDQDRIMNEAEVNEVLRRLRAIPGVTVNEPAFTKAALNKPVKDTMKIIRNLLTSNSGNASNTAVTPSTSSKLDNEPPIFVIDE
jgi:hypothetical protein